VWIRFTRRPKQTNGLIMILRYIIPALAALGIVFGVFFTFNYGKAQDAKPNQLAHPPSTPFEDTVSGTGIIEANTRNIEVGSHLSGIVTKLWVTEGDVVKANAPLFQVDDSMAKADLEAKTKEMAAAQARVENSRVALADEQEQLKRYESLSTEAVSQNDVIRHRFATKRASSNIDTAQAEFESAKAQLHSAKVTLDHLTVRAPLAGRILKVRIHPGEFVTAGGAGDAPVLMGNDTPLYLRVTIDENDVWRFDAKAKAAAALRSNKDIRVPLTFVRTEPYVLPKKNLSGEVLERVDTRVLEVVYAIDPSDKPLYIGQQMDVFIEAGK